MNDPVVVRLVVGGLIAVILVSLSMEGFTQNGGDVFSDAVKIGLGALAGILARVGPTSTEVTVANPPNDPVQVTESVRPPDA